MLLKRRGADSSSALSAAGARGGFGIAGADPRAEKLAGIEGLYAALDRQVIGHEAVPEKSDSSSLECSRLRWRD
jgi:hypothetical protein